MTIKTYIGLLAWTSDNNEELNTDIYKVEACDPKNALEVFREFFEYNKAGAIMYDMKIICLDNCYPLISEQAGCTEAFGLEVLKHEYK